MMNRKRTMAGGLLVGVMCVFLLAPSASGQTPPDASEDAGPRSVMFTLYMVEGVREGGEDSIPSELQGLIAEIRGDYAFHSYRLMDTSFVQTAANRGPVYVTSVVPVPTNPLDCVSIFSSFRIDARQVVEEGDKPALVGLEFEFIGEMPVRDFKYVGEEVVEQLSFRNSSAYSFAWIEDGKPTVLGKVNLEGYGDSVFLVVVPTLMPPAAPAPQSTTSALPMNALVTLQYVQGVRGDGAQPLAQPLAEAVEKIPGGDSYQGYKLVDTNILRVFPGRNFSASSPLSTVVGLPEPGGMHSSIGAQEIVLDGNACWLRGLDFNVDVPYKSVRFKNGRASYNIDYKRVGVQTSLHLPLGTYAVIGKLNVDRAGNSLYVIAKVENAD